MLRLAVVGEGRVFCDECSRCSLVNIEEADANLLRGIQIGGPQELGELGVAEMHRTAHCRAGGRSEAGSGDRDLQVHRVVAADADETSGASDAGGLEHCVIGGVADDNGDVIRPGGRDPLAARVGFNCHHCCARVGKRLGNA